MQLQPRDEELVTVLTQKLRVLSLAQIAATWWSAGEVGLVNARRRLRALQREGLLHKVTVLARPLPEIASPLIAWRPGDAEPDFGAAAYRCQSRWSAAAERTPVYVASRHAANLFGGRAPGKLKHEHQVTHDLGVAAMYLTLRATDAERADTWVGEDVLAPHRRGEKLPDAVLVRGAQQEVTCAMEFGGAYDARRLRGFHADCASRSLPYEVW